MSSTTTSPDRPVPAAEPSDDASQPSDAPDAPQSPFDDPDDYPGLTLSRVLGLARTQLRRLILGTVFLFISASMGLAYPQAIRVIIDTVVDGGGRWLIDAAAVAMAGMFLVAGVSMALRSYFFTVAGERIVADLRRDLYTNVIAQDVAFFDTRRTGELLNRLSSDTTVLQNTVTVNVSMALRNLATTAGGIALLFWTSPRLTALMLAVVPPLVIGAVVFGRRIRRLSRDVQDALARASEVAEETIAGVRTVRAFAREPQEVARYALAVDRSFDLARTRTRVSSTFFGAVSFAGYAAVAIVLWYGGHLVADGAMSVGDLTSFVLYTLIVAFALGALGGLWADFMKASGAAQRVFAIMDRIPGMRESGEGTERVPDGAVALDGVTFHYPSRPDVRVLDDLTLRLDPGRVVALVGPSGGGKSTVAAMIARFYDPDRGRISIGGVDIRQLDPDDLREQIGIVAQEPVLFSTTIAENIRYGRPDASDEELEDAARAAFAHDFIEGFPDGYQTEVGERGVQLSGGQKQRVAIARALLKDPRILILDEATSALDAESEAVVQRALDRLMQGRTTMVIAHRLSTIRDADEVVVIDAGKAVEQGTHDALVKAGGAYARLVGRQ